MVKAKYDTTTKAVRFTTEAGFTNADTVAPAIVLVRVDHEVHEVSFCHLRGGSVSVDDLVDFCLHDKDVRRELRWAQWAQTQQGHKGRVRYQDKWFGRVKEGVSGCKDYVLSRTTLNSPSWAAYADIRATEVVRKIHVSMFGKLNEGFPDMQSEELRAFLSLYFGGREKFQEALVETIGQTVPVDGKGLNWSYTDIKPVYGDMMRL